MPHHQTTATYSSIGSLNVEDNFKAFIENEVLPNTHVSNAQFWAGAEKVINQFTQQNKSLLVHRETLQTQIDHWHQTNPQGTATEYKTMLQTIGYLKPQPAPFSISVDNVDDEIANIAGPQLVVPVSNARFAINAANARWGSLYDAFYGTDVISDEDGCAAGTTYNPRRGAKVISKGCEFLDTHFALQQGSHADVTEYRIDKGTLHCQLASNTTALKQPQQAIGFQGSGDKPNTILLKNNGLHIELCIDRQGNIGSTSASGLQDLVLESAMSCILDCEDSVAAVDAEDKTGVYRNWLGLMQGSLVESFEKQGKTVSRVLNQDRHYTALDGSAVSLHGRALMLVRNVGHLMQTDAIVTEDGEEVYEGILDAIVTTTIALHDLRQRDGVHNSRTGSIYIVKPKMHGPDEVQMSCALFDAVEDMLSLPRHCIKIGIMDEERRTTVNLSACIEAAKNRVMFINTGFLDRTGDEIHTSMHAGAMVKKTEMKQQPWIMAYEDWNVDTGLQSGFSGKAQIGKGMWAMPDEMAAMIENKIAHPKSGANTAWVPSPVGATLHAMHYHQVDVFAQQQKLQNRAPANINQLLSIPLKPQKKRYSEQEIQDEIDNNAQGILGYVVRWIDHGVGCSKVPDINHIGLMEDRATLRISSQLLANWLHQGICTEQQVMARFEKMASIVDQQNSHDSEYQPMVNNLSGNHAFQAACELVLKGKEQPSGYTEPLLHGWRRKYKRECVINS